MIRSSFHHGDENALAVELGHVFGKNLTEARIVRNDVMLTSGEYYCFVDCDDYNAHVESLISSVAVSGVVSSYDSPEMFSDSDVDSFLASVDAKDASKPLRMGDVVRVSENHWYLGGLYGIVEASHDDHCHIELEEEERDEESEWLIVDRIGAPHCHLHFRFYTKKLFVSIEAAMLEHIGGVFSHVKAPVTVESIEAEGLESIAVPEAQEAVSKVVGHSKIRRRSDRKRSAKRRG